MATYFVFSVILTAAYFIFNLLVKKPEKKSTWVWVSIISVVIGGAFMLLNYFLMPTYSWKRVPMYLEIVIFMWMTLAFTAPRVDYPFENKVWLGGFITAIATVVLLIFAGIYTWDLFHAKYQQNLLQVEVVGDEEKIVSPIPVEKICTVSPQVAERVILTKMGDLKNTYELGEMTLIWNLMKTVVRFRLLPH